MNYSFAHTCIRVRDLEKSLAFYQNALGLKEARRKDFPQEEFTLVFLEDAAKKHQLELTYNYDRQEPYEIGEGYGHMAMLVDDLEKSHEKHKNEGYAVTALKGLPGGPAKFYFIEDPDGYKIEIIRR